MKRSRHQFTVKVLKMFNYRKILFLLPFVCLGLASCNVHEWPEPEPVQKVGLHLVYSTDFPILEYNVSSRDNNLTDVITSHSLVDKGYIRYVIRAYPLINNEIESFNKFSEFQIIEQFNIAFDRDVDIDLSPGEYRIFVWSDIRETFQEDHFYDPYDFSELKINRHESNTDYRDCFRGSEIIHVSESIEFQEPISYVIEMERPVAKFEFITNDILEFKNTRANEISDYKVKFFYVGFMPSAYSIFDDKPSDSETGKSFDGKLTNLTENEASMGFDYIYINHTPTQTSVQIALYDKDDKLLSLSDAIDVPIKRSNHTVIRGSFLMSEGSGEMGIDPGFSGDWNVEL